MKVVRNILASLGWILAVLTISHAIISIQPYRYAKPENPMPPVETIKSMKFIDRTANPGPTRQIADSDFSMVSLLFEGSRRDPKPAKWVVLGELTVTLKSGDTVTFDLYSTRQPTGAFKVNGQYYRGGIDEQFRRVLTKEISNKALDGTSQ